MIDDDETAQERLLLPPDVHGERRTGQPGIFRSLKDFESLGLTLAMGFVAWLVIAYAIWRAWS